MLIYYANETAPAGWESENFQTIIGWLRSSDDADHLETARQLETDATVFPAAVDVETAEIESGIIQHDLQASALIVTNRLARSGRCRLRKEGSDGFRDVPLPVDADADPVLAANPLATRETLKQLLALAAMEFDSARDHFVLVVKSHGGDSRVITPRLIVRADQTNREDLLKLASSSANPNTSPPMKALGISGADFLSTLGDSRLQFSLVFIEACRATTSTTIGDVPPNVDRLMTIHDHADYVNILWGDVLRSAASGGSLTNALLSPPSDKFVVKTTDGWKPVRTGQVKGGKLPLVVYFLPLGAWLLWVIGSWIRSKPALVTMNEGER